jgi:hypothetical protein
MASPITAGKELKHYCPRCALDLWHTVIAVMNQQPVRVRCNTCKGERNYRAPKVQEIVGQRKRVESRPKASGSHPDFYQQKLRDAAMRTPKKYSALESFEPEDVVVHPTFGKGVVLKLVFPDRMDVIFQDSVRTLVRKAAE